MTTADLSFAPEPIRTLVAGLEREGFTLVSEEGSGPVNRLLELRREACSLRITADRGEWWIELGGPTLGDWFDPDVWEACLDGLPVQMEPAELEDRVEFVSRRWPEIARVLIVPTDVGECLDRTRSIRARTRLSLPPRLEN